MPKDKKIWQHNRWAVNIWCQMIHRIEWIEYNNNNEFYRVCLQTKQSIILTKHFCFVLHCISIIQKQPSIDSASSITMWRSQKNLNCNSCSLNHWCKSYMCKQYGFASAFQLVSNLLNWMASNKQTNTT